MGIESDQLVYDYLSQVGDLAQRQSLTSGDRMRLVSRLRAEIERRRADEGAETPAAVQRILDGLGTPSEAVAGAGSSSGGDDGPGTGRVPVQRREGESVRPPGGALPPHLATEEELRPRGGGDPDWWRMAPGPFDGGGAGDRVHGFVGGIEVPDMLRPPKEAGVAAAAPAAAGLRKAAKETEAALDEEEDEAAEDAEDAGRVPLSPVLVLVAVLLVVGAVLGNWFVLVAGWGLAYLTRRLTPAESKWAVMGVPGLAAAGGVAWLWGRVDERWGEPVPQGAMGTALAETLPVVVRVAAVASALFVMWRARKPG
ncbi:hypothetical protein BLA24_27760 [Streptomyces cinnamoneus]|uniref:Uncharacterized protein n=1 Tax=Streptomyces cinnamoneus TaxID=53446 RepID=A0A2G1XCC5_STRCJ|nr:hypothetical protein [Streptomyces cinnamoneus]PHQ48860.1 hypothetical protein BLA24_27760 [Streptomyces cinnamoneus]PPT14493.1 hypothetical protein CYQ11_17880 [Streptomyces cinnamoneus]